MNLDTFPYEWQQATNWCWAACACMASRAFGRPTPAQCALVQQITGVSGLCSVQPSDPNSPLTPDQLPPGGDEPLATTAVPNAFSAVGVQAIPLGATLPPNINLSLGNGGFVLLLLDVQGEYHYMLIIGLEPPAPAPQHTYAISDPNPQIGLRSSIPFSVLQNAYGQGGIVAGWRLVPAH